MADTKESSANLNQTQLEFDRHWQACLPKFKVAIGLKSLSITLRHPQTQLPAKPHEVLGGTFQDWSEIQSPWDRQGLIFEVICNTLKTHLKPWQIANYLTVDRRAIESFKLLQSVDRESLETDDLAPYCDALSRSLFCLNLYEDALHWATKANQIEPDNRFYEVNLADAYSFCGQGEKADEIYNARMANLSPSNERSISQTFIDLFSVETGVVPSPIFAFQLSARISETRQSEEFWKLGETEFYYSPHFRMQHAYHLGQTDRLQECFAKLLALVQEMPWLREANLNLLRLFEHFDPSGTKIMPEFQAELRQRIAERGWTAEGMEEVSL